MATDDGQYSPADFWGAAVWAEGYAAVPQRLLAKAAELGLDAIDQALVVQLLGYKMTEASPWPSVATLARRLNLSDWAVRRRLRRLHAEMGLLVREQRPGRTNEYNLRPLASALRALPSPLSPAPRGDRHQSLEAGSDQRPPTLGAGAYRTRTTEEHEAEKEQHNNVIASLRREGVKGSVALGLVSDYGPEVCRQQLEWVGYRDARDRAAVLVESIKKGWGPPARWLREDETYYRR